MRMKLAAGLMRRAAGYRVHFERREDGMLCSDYFPERDEPAIAELDDAWRLAGEWAKVDPTLYVNVYVVSGYDWVPVDDYLDRRLNVHPSPPKAPQSDEAVDPVVANNHEPSTRA